MPLPLLPAFVFNPNAGKENFRKPQTFTFENKFRLEKDKFYVHPFNVSSLATKLLEAKTGKPSWLAFDKHVLCFHAYVFEQIPPVSDIEQSRFRKCKIYYYLEDDTMQIVESQERNSGIPQGTIVLRHRFRKPKSHSSNSEYYGIEDLNVAIDLEIYGRVYKTTSCDKFTRSFLSELGVRVNDPVSVPSDPYQENRKMLQDTSVHRKPKGTKDTLGQFLQFNTHVLRFYCVWDDTHNMFGMRRRMVLYYYLDDDTVEICEQRRENSGQADTKLFLKRSRLPKAMDHLPLPGELTTYTMLNTSGSRAYSDYRYILDLNAYPGPEFEYYKDNDLDLGLFINVYGRKFLLYDCDEFTKTFYKLKYDKDLVPYPLAKDVNPVTKREIYPRNAFGTHEMSLQTCLNVVPKRCKKNLLQFLNKDKYELGSGVLTFSACILTNEPIKKSRRFVITYFLDDDTIEVKEPQQANSGIVGGKMLSRMKIEKPESKKMVVPIYYTLEDLYIGKVLHIRGDDFLLTNADEQTLRYMENNLYEFPYSDFKKVQKKAKEWLSSETCEKMRVYFQSVDGGTGFVPLDVFRKALYDSIPEKVPEQVMITLGRQYADMEDTDLKWDEILEMTQTELRRKNYNDFENLLTALKEFDTEKKGTFSEEELYLHLLSCRVPLPRDLLKCFVYKFPASDRKCINFACVINSMNYFENPVSLSSPVPKMFDINWLKKTKVKSVERINYNAFINDLISGGV